MPSSLTRVLPFVLGFSPRPPASVCGTDDEPIASTFSRQCGFICFATYFHSPSRFRLAEGVLHYPPAFALGPALPSTGSYYPPVSVLHSIRRYRNINLLSIAYDFCPRLRSDLPWADEPSPGNLGLSTCEFLARISLLIPAFSLLHRPQCLSILLLPMHDAPLPITAIYNMLNLSALHAL